MYPACTARHFPRPHLPASCSQCASRLHGHLARAQVSALGERVTALSEQLTSSRHEALALLAMKEGLGAQASAAQ